MQYLIPPNIQKCVTFFQILAMSWDNLNDLFSFNLTIQVVFQENILFIINRKSGIFMTLVCFFKRILIFGSRNSMQKQVDLLLYNIDIFQVAASEKVVQYIVLYLNIRRSRICIEKKIHLYHFILQQRKTFLCLDQTA